MIYMPKRINYKFNQKAKATQNVLKFLANNEGKFQREIISKELGHHKLFSELKQAGFIRPTSTGEKGLWERTKAFELAYKSQIDPGKNFCNSNAVKHGTGVNNAIQMIPSTVSLTNIKSSGDVQKEYSDHRSEYKPQEDALRTDAIQHYQDIKSQYDAAGAAERVDLYKTLNHAHNLAQIAGGESTIVRTPDLQITFDKSELQDFRENLYNHFQDLNLRTYCDSYRQYERAIDTIDTILTTTTETNIELAIEITTNNYTMEELKMHENYTTVTEIQQIIIPSR